MESERQRESFKPSNPRRSVLQRERVATQTLIDWGLLLEENHIITEEGLFVVWVSSLPSSQSYFSSIPGNLRTSFRGESQVPANREFETPGQNLGSRVPNLIPEARVTVDHRIGPNHALFLLPSLKSLLFRIVCLSRALPMLSPWIC